MHLSAIKPASTEAARNGRVSDRHSDKYSGRHDYRHDYRHDDRYGYRHSDRHGNTIRKTDSVQAVQTTRKSQAIRCTHGISEGSASGSAGKIYKQDA